MNVTCKSCGREAECITVADGTTYRPIAWSYPDPTEPLIGVCGLCLAVGGLALLDSAAESGDVIAHDDVASPLER